MSGEDRTPRPASNVRLDGLSLLVVEDDSDIRLMTTTVLRSAGASVGEAANGGEAEQRLAAGGIDGVVLDWNLTDVSGEDFLRTLESRHPVVWQHCLVVTGDLVRSCDVHAAAAMGRPVLAKPFRPAQLLGQLAALFGTPAD